MRPFDRLGAIAGLADELVPADVGEQIAQATRAAAEFTPAW
jgi:hypothetical protein